MELIPFSSLSFEFALFELRVVAKFFCIVNLSSILLDFEHGSVTDASFAQNCPVRISLVAV